MYLAQLAKRGELRKVGRGIYASPLRKESEESGLAEVSMKHPRAVVCLLSALSVHGLTTQSPHEVWIAVGSKDRAPKMDYPPLKVVRFGGDTLTEGSEAKVIEGIPVQITNIPKTIADCFKFRNKIGLDVALEALKDAWRDKRVSIDDLKNYFTAVVDWIGSVFTRSPDKEMRGLEWGRLYEEHHNTPYNSSTIDKRLTELRGDPAVHNAKGIYEFLLGGEKETQLLDVRLFDEKVKRQAYQQQKSAAEATGKSNCPLCAIGPDATRNRIYKPSEMDADHISAWSKGGDSSAHNCQMLCVMHNRAKGNR